MTNGEGRMPCSVVGRWDIETWRGLFSFEHKKHKETSQLALQMSAVDARDMRLSYIMVRKSK